MKTYIKLSAIAVAFTLAAIGLGLAAVAEPYVSDRVDAGAKLSIAKAETFLDCREALSQALEDSIFRAKVGKLVNKTIAGATDTSIEYQLEKFFVECQDGPALTGVTPSAAVDRREP